MEALKEQETINQIASRYDVLPVQVSQWKAHMLKSLPGAFKGGGKHQDAEAEWEQEKKQFYQKIGQLEMERDWLYRGAERRQSEAPNKNPNSLASSPEAKRAMIEKEEKVSITRPCELLGLPPSSAYYKPIGMSAWTLELMRLIDAIYTEFPFFGSRQIKRMLRTLGHKVGRRRVRRLMRLMGLEALCPKPNLSKPTPGHKIYPYLMKGLVIDRPNRAWCADITYIRLDGGFVYLVAIMDWYSRKILAWELSNSMDASFCVKALNRAIAEYGPPEVMNTDQGSQFTGEDWISVLKNHGVKISMDGRGRALDNVFVERFWRTLKYEEVYRREYSGIADARKHLAHYIEIYNTRRPHSSLNDRTPARVHAEIQVNQAA